MFFLGLDPPRKGDSWKVHRCTPFPSLYPSSEVFPKKGGKEIFWCPKGVEGDPQPEFLCGQAEKPATSRKWDPSSHVFGHNSALLLNNHLWRWTLKEICYSSWCFPVLRKTGWFAFLTKNVTQNQLLQANLTRSIPTAWYLSDNTVLGFGWICSYLYFKSSQSVFLFHFCHLLMCEAAFLLEVPMTNSRSYHSQHKQPGIFSCCPRVSSAPSPTQVSPLGVKVMFPLSCLVQVCGTLHSLHQNCVWSSVSMLGIKQARFPRWEGDQCGWHCSGWLLWTSFPAQQLPWGGGFWQLPAGTCPRTCLCGVGTQRGERGNRGCWKAPMGLRLKMAKTGKKKGKPK